MASKFDFNPGYASRLKQHTLDNGLRLVLLEDRSRPLVCVNLWYHVGSKNERPGRTGFAHLFEHMLFQGSEHVGTNDHFAFIQQVGGVANGSTSFDRTNYYETLPAHALELGLWLESDRMGFLLPGLDEEKLANQKDVVMNERRERIDNQPYGRAFEILHERLYPDEHPYGWPVIGYMDDIAAVTLPEVHEFFSKHYVPDNTVLTLVGDFDPKEAKSLVERYFGCFGGRGEKNRERATMDSLSLPPPPSSAVRVEHRDRVNLPRLYLASRSPGIVSPAKEASSWQAGHLYGSAVTGGKSSPLYRDLVYERELAQDVYCDVLTLEMESTFLAAMTLRPGVEPEAAEAALLEHLESHRSRPLETDDIDRALARIRTSHIHEIEAFESRADALSHYATYFGDAALIDSELEHFAGIGAEGVQEFAQNFLEPEQMVTLWVLPENGAKP